MAVKPTEREPQRAATDPPPGAGASEDKSSRKPRVLSETKGPSCDLSFHNAGIGIKWLEITQSKRPNRHIYDLWKGLAVDLTGLLKVVKARINEGSRGVRPTSSEPVTTTPSSSARRRAAS